MLSAEPQDVCKWPAFHHSTLGMAYIELPLTGHLVSLDGTLGTTFDARKQNNQFFQWYSHWVPFLSKSQIPKYSNL